MVTDAALNEIREDLKRRLAAGEFRTLIDILLDGIGRVVRMITRHPRPISLWYSSTILFLVIVLIGFGAMLLAGEAAVINTVVATSPIGLLALGGYLAVASMVASNAYVHRVFVAFGDRILDTVESTASVHDFERWLAAVCNWPVHLIFCLVAGVLGGSYLMYIASANLGLSIGVGFALAGLLFSACSAAFMYLLIHMVALSARVGRYQLKLYSADPSSSEVIGLLSSTLSTFVVLIAVYDAVLTLGPVLAGIWNQGYIAIVVLLWIPLVAMFILNQTSLSNIIRRAKWKTLNEIQARVEKLHAADNLAEEDTLEAINRLMDYHDRIKGTRNSALNARAVLSLLNSLLLPLLALLLANLDTILSLLR